MNRHTGELSNIGLPQNYELNLGASAAMSQKRKLQNRMFLATALLACAVSHGCGHGLATVQGKVTLDGKVLEGGNVTLYPVGPGPLSYSGIESDGSYRIRTASRQGVLPGKY